MADSASKLVLDVIVEDCPALCPYRYGDGDGSRKRLSDKISKKLKHRVADGNDVRALESRVKSLEAALIRAVEIAEKNRKLNPQEIAQFKRVLQTKDKRAAQT